jgi:hydrogenase expression/formation protein HypE
MKTEENFSMSCPIEHSQCDRILLSHGGGGKKMDDLIQNSIISKLQTNTASLHDSVSLEVPGAKIAFTSDSFVVSPLFFSGANIGSLAVYGTVNDLAMSGAKPLWLSLSFILEEGFPISDLDRIMDTIQEAAETASVKIVTGDTKVVERGKGDGIFINTSGIGLIEHNLCIHPNSIRDGDAIIINGDIGRHGTAVMSARDGIELNCDIKSDCAPLNHTVGMLIANQIPIHCMRDLTRGGLGSALNELARATNLGIEIDDECIPLNPTVEAFCEVLGLEAHFLANEGRFVCFTPQEATKKTLSLIREDFPEAIVIGKVTKEHKGIVTIRDDWGGKKILHYISGEQLPRIC